MSDSLITGRVDRAARTILEARRTGALIEMLPPNDQPRSLEEGYAIQQAAIAQWPDKIAGWKVCRLERRPGVRDRIEYLSQQDEESIAEKSRRIEEALWSMHEADIGDYFESHEVDGKVIERPKRLADLPPEIRKNIEKIALDGKGRVVPQLYSKLAASQELRKMLNIGRSEHRNDLSRLSDAELIQQLADQARQWRSI
jgi:Terminase small subunit